MDRKYKEIRGRYDDVVCGVTDYQMFQDIRALLGYVDQLHQRMVDQAAEKAVQAAFQALSDDPAHPLH